ncbi:MAG: 4Fe-4S dicluster domain-containing protein [Hyphomicrobiaceae bacterium]|nr:4Fe-4S dicluster domain-containing protein [Hyphomicrobiaceae bacterium]
MSATTKHKLLVCNCQRTMEVDGARLARTLGLEGPLAVHRELCRSESASFEAALAAGPVHVACTQEAPLFRDIAEDKGLGDVPMRFTNIRERAGWCEAKPAALPKMAALLAEAAHEAEPAGLITLKSEGVCLVYGAGQAALDAAHELSPRLSVSVLLTDAADAIPPSVVDVPIHRGRIRRASGHLGAFEIEVDGYAPMLPSSRTALEFVLARDGAMSKCDVILDLSGGRPLFPGGGRRDGYVHADPADPAAVARAMFKASDLVGEFEKPRYVVFDAGLCAHARSQKVGCTNCLDGCPTGAISPAGDHVAVDPGICGGCGTCSAVCPTGAVSYSFPGREDLVTRVRVLLQAYRTAGGTRPVLLLHDEKHGSPMIAAMARFGRGLPPNVLPLALHSVFHLGHDVLAAMLALGAEQIVVLAPGDAPEELPPLEGQVALLAAFTGPLGHAGPRARVVVERDPDAVESLLYELPKLPELAARAFSAAGGKREVARTALAALNETAPQRATVIALPDGAPYGRIHIDVGGCTLCLSCIGACPANALSDDPDRPQVSFTEAACVQCGVCVATCPEKVIRLEPRYNFTPSAMTPEILKGEEPFECVSCGKPIGARSTIEKVLARLEGHSMFRGERQLRLVQMCDTCRIVTVAEEGNDPLKAGERPRMRTTDDDLAEAARAARDPAARKPEDFLS